MRVGVIGLALIGGVHMSRWKAIPEADLVAGCDVEEDLAERVGREQGIRTYTSAEQMLDAEELDAVSIGAPAKTHFPLTKLAADRGIHVLCEKPMASDVPDCRKMIQVCRERGVTLMIGATKRYVPMLARLRELLDGDLGPADYVLHQYPDPGKSPRDWSWAEDLMEPLIAMGALAEPEDLVLASGRLRVVQDWVNEACRQLELDPDRCVEVDPDRLHAGDRPHTFGNIERTQQRLGWTPRVDLPKMVRRLIAFDMVDLKNNK